MGEGCDEPPKVLDGKVGDSIAAAGSSREPHDYSITKNLGKSGQEEGVQSQPILPGKEALHSFLKQWPSAVKAIGENEHHSVNLKERVRKIEIDLIYIKRSLGLVDEWGKCVMEMFHSLHETVGYLIQQLKPTDGPPSSSNGTHDNQIHNMLYDIGEKIGKIKTQALPFIRMPDHAFICFFKQRLSSAVTAIADSKDDSGKIKQRIENDLRDIERSLGSVDKWDISVMDMFEFLDGKVDELIAQVGDTASAAAAGSSNEQHDNLNEKLKLICREIGKMKMNSQPLIRQPKIPPAAEKITDEITNWRKLESEEEIMDCQAMADALSAYEDLQPRLKLCFLSLSMFPEGKYIRKRSLIYWWIGEDFLGDKDVEQGGEDCFKKLCESGLIEPISDDQSRSPHSCRLHPWIRWMAIRIAKETMFLDFDSDGKPSSGPSECLRRACVATTEVRRAEKVNLEGDVTELRSLFNIDVHCLECDVEEFKKLDNMVALQLGRWINDLPRYHIELVNPPFLEHLGLLKRLRYLGLQGISRIEKLPDSIAGLNELRVLDLRACHNLEKLPTGITSLMNLTHLDVSECYLLEYMPKGLGSLSKLQFLDGFVISSNLRSHHACELSELANVPKLQKLSISLSIPWLIKELEVLKDFPQLQTLTVTWGEGEEVLPSKVPERMDSITDKRRKKAFTRRFEKMSHLPLPLNLTKLDLRCFPEEEPILMASQNKSLEKLYFRGGKPRNLSTIEKTVVSEVKTLRLRFLHNLSIRRPELETLFPRLKYAEIFKCRRFDNSSFKGEAGDGKASTSNANITPVVYCIVAYSETHESAK